MESELMQLTTIAVVLAPVTTAAMQLVKQAGIISGRWINLAALLLGIILAVIWALAFGHIDQLGPYLLAGMLSGLSASGVYEVFKPRKEVN